METAAGIRRGPLPGDVALTDRRIFISHSYSKPTRDGRSYPAWDATYDPQFALDMIAERRRIVSAGLSSGGLHFKKSPEFKAAYRLSVIRLITGASRLETVQQGAILSQNLGERGIWISTLDFLMWSGDPAAGPDKPMYSMYGVGWTPEPRDYSITIVQRRSALDTSDYERVVSTINAKALAMRSRLLPIWSRAVFNSDSPPPGYSVPPALVSAPSGGAFCTACGSARVAGAKFCTKCGAPLAG